MVIDENRPDLHLHMEPAELQKHIRRHFTAYFSRCVSLTCCSPVEPLQPLNCVSYSISMHLLVHCIQKLEKKHQPYGYEYRFTTRRQIYLFQQVTFISCIFLDQIPSSVDPVFGQMSNSLFFRYMTALFSLFKIHF